VVALVPATGRLHGQLTAPTKTFMSKSFLTIVSLAILLLAPAAAAVPAAPQEPAAANIGFALYSKTQSPGTLIARWMYTQAYRGPGLATGGPKEGFVGHYHVRYFYDDGKFSDEYDLAIEKTGDCYAVTWTSEGKVQAVGVGMEVENGLAVGWRRVAD
jgi:opacity protein-like surface antigen